MYCPVETDVWASAYIRATEADGLNSNHPDWWAIGRFMEIIENDDKEFLEECWLAILRILEDCQNEKVLAVLAAGPLEDLIHNCGSSFINRIEEESRRSPRFRWLLGGVWESGSPDIWSRVESARDECW